MRFYSKVKQSIEQRNSLLCVGLDPVWENIPAFLRYEKDPILSFCLQIIAATKKWVAAYKPNFAFFEALGPQGMEILLQVVEAIPSDIVVIGDAKRGDIGYSDQMYAKAVFEVYGCDAVTANPYQGHDSLAPFLDYEEKGTFILCLTSNPGAHDFQIPKQLYLRVAEKCETLEHQEKLRTGRGGDPSRSLSRRQANFRPHAFFDSRNWRAGRRIEKDCQRSRRWHNLSLFDQCVPQHSLCGFRRRFCR